MKINSRLLGILVLVLIFGGICLASALNLWHTAGSKRGFGAQKGHSRVINIPADIRVAEQE